MMFSLSIIKRIVSILIVVVVAMQIIFTHSVLALNQTNAYLHHQCIKSQGTYDLGSQYEEDLNDAIKFASKLLNTNGYTETSSGNIFTRFQCRGDLSISQCRSCYATAFSEVQKRCLRNKGRIIWYDYCVLAISSDYMSPEIDYQNIFYLYNKKDVSVNKELFNKKTKDILYKLKDKAIQEKNTKTNTYLYAAGEESLGTTKLYAMVQCMKALTNKNCSVCLDKIMEKLSKCCNGKKGGRVLCTFCNFRYEVYPFVKHIS